ncbi:MAG TPA: DUF4282 domain-containing protein [Candidatus Corynebacterium gallistercoris]|uniref:DUF4282 domain-containing protein n=1 Tax=Candidatus Corynebacterium gallistercoris TaxID=2838530 RepID=A0A9D1URQ5_9CORY|nr:DUF4282 domain-containing protein [Candidatus Corynebacterium gallistercoris]
MADTNVNQPAGGVPAADSSFGKFLTALGNVGFTKYITTTFMRVMFIVGVVFIGFSSLYAILNGFLGFSASWITFEIDGEVFSAASEPTFAAGLVNMIVVLVGALLQICMWRVMLEVAHAVVRTAESWARIQQRASSGAVTL